MSGIPIANRIIPFTPPYGAEIINHEMFIKYVASYYKPTLYIEYGVSYGYNLASISSLCEKCIGVDIKQKPVLLDNISNISYFQGKTRDFKKYINQHKLQYELAFIDADHNSEEAYFDFTDLFENLMDNGIIFIHDTYPTLEKLTDPSWCNDSYKVPEKIRKNYSERADVLTLPICPGLTIVRKRSFFSWMKTSKIKTWVINLEKDKERQEYMKTVLDNSGLDYSFFKAVYGGDLHLSRTKDHIIAEKDGIVFINPIATKSIELTNGEIGASISHRLLYKQLVDDQEYDKYLIFEDDIILKNKVKFQELLENLPPSSEYDIARFEISRNNIITEKSMNNYYNIYKNTPDSFKIGAFGYIITKRGAINILKNYGFTIIGAPDDFLNNFLAHKNGVFIEPKEHLIDARYDIPSTIWGNSENNKKIEYNTKRIIIFGSDGMLGRYMSTYFSDKYTVINLTRKLLDIGTTSTADIIKYLNCLLEKDDLVINCAGIINKRTDISENEMIKVNSVFPYILSQIVKEKSSWLIQPTTDCVYSGRKGGYTQLDQKDEQDLYGITKSIGETVIPDRTTVIRTSIIGEEISNKRSLIEWAKSSRGQQVNGYINHKWNGITCLQYAKEVENMIKIGFPKNIHFSSFWVDGKNEKKDYISKYDLLHLINNTYKLELDIKEHFAEKSIDRTLSGIQVGVSLNKQLEELKDFKLV